MKLNLPALDEALEDVEFFERDRTDSFIVELAIVFYNSGVSLRKTTRVLGWIGVECSHVAVWNWIQKFGRRLSATGWEWSAKELNPSGTSARDAGKPVGGTGLGEEQYLSQPRGQKLR